MSFLSVNDFADYVGVKPSTLRVHIKRDKVVKSGKLINTDHPTNAIYIQEQKERKTEPVTPVIPEKVKGKNVKSKQSPPTESNEMAIKAGVLTDLVLRKKKADLRKTEKEAEYKHLQIQKLQGKLMPLDLVQQTQTINIQSVFRAFESAAENVASIYNERLGGDRADLADMTTRMREELDRAVKNARQQSKEEIEALIDEYSQTLNRGEKK